jgi:hypothetical protein
LRIWNFSNFSEVQDFRDEFWTLGKKLGLSNQNMCKKFLKNIAHINWNRGIARSRTGFISKILNVFFVQIMFFTRAVASAVAVDRNQCPTFSWLKVKSRELKFWLSKSFKDNKVCRILRVLKFRFLRVPPCEDFWDFVKELFSWPENGFNGSEGTI